MFIENNITSSDKIVNDPKTIILKKRFTQGGMDSFLKDKRIFLIGRFIFSDLSDFAKPLSSKFEAIFAKIRLCKKKRNKNCRFLISRTFIAL
jgi:hypothetical protein